MRAIFILILKLHDAPNGYGVNLAVGCIVFASNLPSYDFGNHDRPLQNCYAFPFRDYVFFQLKASHTYEIACGKVLQMGMIRECFLAMEERAGGPLFGATCPSLTAGADPLFCRRLTMRLRARLLNHQLVDFSDKLQVNP